MRSCRINHFGKNPVSGGSPPSESSVREARAAMEGALVQAIASVLIFVVDINLNTKKVADVMIKYVIRTSIVNCWLNCEIITIHPRWAIDEYARIFRSCVWFRPPQPPRITDESPSTVSSCGGVNGAIWIISANGASFCQVAKISPVGRSSPCMTWGIHMCIGARPIFSANAIVIAMVEMGVAVE